MKIAQLLNYERDRWTPGGGNDPRLLRAKRRYDPSNRFRGRHVVAR